MTEIEITEIEKKHIEILSRLDKLSGEIWEKITEEQALRLQLKDIREKVRNQTPVKFNHITENELDMDIRTLGWFSYRATTCFMDENIDSLRKLLEWSEYDLLKTPNLGKKSLLQIRSALQEHGLELK